MDQKWNHLWVKNGTIYGSKMEPFMDQKWKHLWVKNGTIYGSKMEPFMNQKWNACRCVPFSHAGFHLLVKNGIFHFPTVRKMDYSGGGVESDLAPHQSKICEDHFSQ